MTTILHTADVHLDRAFSGVGMASGMAAKRRQELRDAIVRLVDLALEMRADAVTVGGDLYEHDRTTLDTGRFLAQQFARVAPARVLIAPGNHDPLVPASLYRQVNWPANVFIFGEARLQPVEVTPGVTVWGAAHLGPAHRENLVARFRVSGSGRHVLLFHGSDTASVPEGKAAHAPFTREDVARTGADFALLGHYHASKLFPAERPICAYPGSPEPLDFTEAGTHHVLRLDIDDAGVRAELLPFGLVAYRTQRIDCSNAETSDDVRAAILALAEDGAITRVLLEGQVQADVDLDIDALYNSCAERFTYLDLVDHTQAAYDLEAIADEETTKGRFVRLMRERIMVARGAEREIVEQALIYGLRAFDRKEVRI
jgi:DNA repair exonuclease SbcCD nuclease subunit